ncbi:MAG: DUF547 domain-containing protein [Cyanobacteria bacterium J06621_8]
MNRLLTLGVISIVGLTGCSNLANSTQNTLQSSLKASTNPTEEATVPGVEVATNAPFNYQDYGEVLQKYVSAQGLVNYEQLQANRQQLDRFNQSLGEVRPETYAGWNETEQIAFLVNAYNSFTLQSIIDQDPIKDSIRDIPGVWRRRKFDLAGEPITLNDIEHKILRREFNEPRIHVALVCAAISCPVLRNEPYLPEKLDAQLNDQTAKFAQSPHGFRLDKSGKTVYLSSIFKWFGQDYEPTYGIKTKFNGNSQQRAVLNHLSPVLDSQTQEFLSQSDYKVRYLDYDWSLNKQ